MPNIWISHHHLDAITTSPQMQSWLMTPASLTARIRQSCPNLQVQVISECLENPLPAEALQLGMTPNTTAWVRCVLLKCQETPWIYARTVIPNFTKKNPWHTLQTLGNKPLGEVLFNDAKLQRTAFEFSAQPLSLWPYLPNLPIENPVSCGYARRSVFRRQQSPLLLTEVFLPSAPFFEQ